MMNVLIFGLILAKAILSGLRVVVVEILSVTSS
jgi:hypothetical protein